MEVYTSKDPGHWLIPISMVCFGKKQVGEIHIGGGGKLLCVPPLDMGTSTLHVVGFPPGSTGEGADCGEGGLHYKQNVAAVEGFGQEY